MIRGQSDIKEGMPCVFLGKSEAIHELTERIYGDERTIEYHPLHDMHYSEYADDIESLDFEKLIASQNIEYIEILLESDFDFQVVTCYLGDSSGGEAIRVLTKERAKYALHELGIELR